MKIYFVKEFHNVIIKEFFICYECACYGTLVKKAASYICNSFIKTERERRRYEEKTASLRQKKRREEAKIYSFNEVKISGPDQGLGPIPG